MSITTMLRIILESLTDQLHRITQTICEANMAALADTGELLAVIGIMQHAMCEAGTANDTDADKRVCLQRLHDKISIRRRHNEYTVGSDDEHRDYASRRCRIDDDALAMIYDVLKGI